MNKTLTIIVAVLGGIMILLLAIVLVLVLQRTLGSDGDATPTTVAAISPPESTAIMEVATVAPPAGQPPATFTPLPTIEATNTAVPVTPSATATPLPTNTLPPPTPTRTPVPIIYPTFTPVPVDTPVPQPPPDDTRGLTATAFNIQSRSDFRVNQQVWFDFQIVNNTGGDVAYNRLGVLPRKDGQDRFDWFQQSYGGPNAFIRTGGLSHEDNIKLPEAGNYTLRLAICFDGYDACNSGGGSWASLSPEIPVTIN